VCPQKQKTHCNVAKDPPSEAAIYQCYTYEATYITVKLMI